MHSGTLLHYLATTIISLSEDYCNLIAFLFTYLSVSFLELGYCTLK